MVYQQDINNQVPNDPLALPQNLFPKTDPLAVAPDLLKSMQPPAQQNQPTQQSSVNPFFQSTDPAISGAIKMARQAGYSDQALAQYFSQKDVSQKLLPQMGKQETMLNNRAPITQPFGNYNPDTEVFSNGYNSGADFGVPVGTKLALPPGKWQIVDSYNQAVAPGQIGDSTNRGYGNSVLAKNIQTGEMLRLSHLSKNMLQPGQFIDGGVVFGASGATGNASGPHLDLEYYDPQGRLADVMSSPYASYIPTVQ